MARKTKGLIAAAMAFAATPKGRKLLHQAQEYANRPETRQRAQQLLSQARSRGKGGTTPSTPVRDSTSPPYGTPPPS